MRVGGHLRPVELEGKLAVDIGDTYSIELAECQTVLRRPSLEHNVVAGLRIGRQCRVEVDAQLLRWPRNAPDGDRDQPGDE